MGYYHFPEAEPWLDMSPLDQVYFISQTLSYRQQNLFEIYHVAEVNVTTLLEAYNSGTTLVMTDAAMGPHNLSYGAFVIHDDHTVSVVRVSNAITVAGTL